MTESKESSWGNTIAGMILVVLTIGFLGYGIHWQWKQEESTQRTLTVDEIASADECVRERLMETVGVIRKLELQEPLLCRHLNDAHQACANRQVATVNQAILESQQATLESPAPDQRNIEAVNEKDVELGFQ